MTIRRWRMQFFGVVILMLLVWGFLNTPDQRAWQVGASGLLGLLALTTAATLTAANFAGKSVPSRLPRVFACLALLLLLLWAVGLMDEKGWVMANWLGSALTLRRKKPVTPESVDRVIDWILFLMRWIAIPLLVIPTSIRAAGARPVRFWKCAVMWIVSFLMGAVLPHVIVHRVPRFAGFWPQMVSAAVRFLTAYLLMITAWVMLGRSVREEVRN
jgi:hypothetical protein